MRRSGQPVEILLGFAAGIITAFFVQQPLLWLLHQLHISDQAPYSTALTLPLGVEVVWSRLFWSGIFGIGLAAFGTRYELGPLYIASTSLFTFTLRTLIDWFVAPLVAPGGLSSVGAIVTPLIVNALWAPATAVLLIGLTLVVGTYASRAPSDLIRH